LWWYFSFVAEPRSYAEVLKNRYVLNRAFRDRNWGIALVIGGVLVAFLVAFSGSSSDSSEVGAEFGSSSFCAADLADAGNAVLALRHGDIVGYGGLSERGRLFAVSEGDKVVKIATQDSLAQVRLTSGAHIGERCWTLVTALR
jgi:hypothetical protein